MADSFSKAFPITTAGYTGTVEAFISTSGSNQTVTIVPVKGTSATQSITALPGVVYPIKCSHIKPGTSTVLGLNS